MLGTQRLPVPSERLQVHLLRLGQLVLVKIQGSEIVDGVQHRCVLYEFPPSSLQLKSSRDYLDMWIYDSKSCRISMRADCFNILGATCL